MLIGLFVALLLLLFGGAPVLLAIGIAGILGMFLTPGVVMAIFPQKMFAMLDSFSLLAMPFFILAGELMSRGGISNKMVAFSDTLVGHMRGGLGHASVVGSMIFAGVSGSSVADTSAIGSILIPAMKERGYQPGFAASILAAAGTIGPIIPPSMTMIIYGSMTGTSIGGLFLSGVIPGIIIGIFLMGTIYIHSFFPQFPALRVTTGKFSFTRMMKALGQVWSALLAPVIILGGILSGVFTAIVTTTVIGIISVAGAFGWLLAYLDFNVIVLALLKSISNDRNVILLVLLGVIFIMGMFIESLAVLIILIPVCIFVTKAYGFDPFHFGLLMTIATQIGAVTPPVAVLLFVATSIAGCKYDETIRYCYPFVAALVAVMLLVAFVPWTATYIPHRFLGP
jgi:TRAP-type C4-dicarboxylate transport system permease large subunit